MANVDVEDTTKGASSLPSILDLQQIFDSRDKGSAALDSVGGVKGIINGFNFLLVYLWLVYLAS